MKLTQHTDYAFRLLIYLAIHEPRPVTIQEISEFYGISGHHLAKIVQTLGREGWIESVRGRSGGVRLAQAPERIPAGAVVRAMERSLAVVECLGEDSTCVIDSACVLKEVLAEARDAFLAVLDGWTVRDLSTDAPGVVPLLIRGDLP
jgi:Rrf2 family nitric oxide-sensitive transcriptional repressor